MKSSKQKRKVQLLIIIAVLICAVVAAGISSYFWLSKKNSQKQYMEQIGFAEKYLAILNYDNAIAAYEKAIRISPREAQAYLNLAEIYIETGETEAAQDILRKGYSATGDRRISDMLERLLLGDYTNQTVAEEIDYTESELELLSAQVMLNQSFIYQLAKYTYNDYESEYGKSSSFYVSSSIGYQLDHELFPGHFYYMNTSANRYVINESTQIPYIRTKPTSIMLTEISSLFLNYEGAVSHSKLEELFGRELKVELDSLADRHIIKLTYAGLQISIQTDAAGNVVHERPWNKLVPLTTVAEDEKETETEEEATEDETESGYETETSAIESGRAAGQVIGALDGEGVAGANITFYSLDNGRQSGSSRTDSAGHYQIELEEGYYEAFVESEGYQPESFIVIIEGAETVDSQNITINPVMATGEIRIVLEWGSSPRDLDSHLAGISSNGDELYIYYGHKTQNLNGQLWASLDLDDTDGYGPETTTVYLDTNASYKFAVYNFNYSGSHDDHVLSNSGATVKVYQDGRSPVTFNVPSGPGAWWQVFEIDGGVIRSINRIE